MNSDDFVPSYFINNGGMVEVIEQVFDKGGGVAFGGAQLLTIWLERRGESKIKRENGVLCKLDIDI